MIVSVVAMTASMTSVVPFTAASSDSRPDSSLRKMFSRTTIASSTRSPTVSESAISDIRFSVNPIAYMMTKAPRRLFGIAMPVMMVDLTLPRKRYTTTTARMIPMIIVSITSSMLRRMYLAVSKMSVIPGFPGFERMTSLTLPMRDMTPSATETGFAPDCLYTSISMHCFIRRSIFSFLIRCDENILLKKPGFAAFSPTG